MKTEPWRITIDTNPDQCNLKCIMCETHSIHNKKPTKRQCMSPTLLDVILDEAVNAGVSEIIPSTMGEPLLYPYFDKFIHILTSSATKLNLTTNGTFPRKGVETWARELLPITSDTKISINGTTPITNEKVMIKAKTGEALKNIEKYLAIRDEVRQENTVHQPTVTLQVTFMYSNLTGIKEVIEYAIMNNVDRVKGHHLWVTHPELEKEDLRHPEHKGIWNNFIDEISPYKKQIKLENFVELSESSFVPEHYNCPFLGKELWIDCVGNYNICCAPSDKRKTLGNFGNIDDKGIKDFFKTESYQSLIENYKHHPLCQKCLLRKCE
ncbi:radical SAM/SPASM domain-containing protein [Desulfobacterota bacterium M19]